jgi:hypothetical protein
MSCPLVKSWLTVTIGNMLCTFEIESQPIDEADLWLGILSVVAWAVRSTYHSTLQSTPG